MHIASALHILRAFSVRVANSIDNINEKSDPTSF
jgi:hypothetical protein